MKAGLVGRGRIVEMELWDQEFIDLESPGHITLNGSGRGEMHFGAVDLTLNWRLNTNGSRVEFAFQGFDEGDQMTGRGWAELDSGKLTGRIVIHLGDESGFVAQKEESGAG